LADLAAPVEVVTRPQRSSSMVDTVGIPLLWIHTPPICKPTQRTVMVRTLAMVLLGSKGVRRHLVKAAAQARAKSSRRVKVKQGTLVAMITQLTINSMATELVLQPVPVRAMLIPMRITPRQQLALGLRPTVVTAPSQRHLVPNSTHTFVMV